MAPVKSSLTNDRRNVTINFTDSTDCSPEEIDWCDRGVTLHTKWYFRQGVEVELAVEVDGKRHLCSGVVVDCESLDEPGHYLMTLFFLEKPCAAIQRAARTICPQEEERELAHSSHR